MYLGIQRNIIAISFVVDGNIIIISRVYEEVLVQFHCGRTEYYHEPHTDEKELSGDEYNTVGIPFRVKIKQP